MDLNEMKELKKYLGYSNKKLAEESGLPLGTVQKVLSGESKAPRYKTLLALSDALNRGLESIPLPYELEMLNEKHKKKKSNAEVREDNLAYEYEVDSMGEPKPIVPDVIEDAWTRKWRRQGTYTVRDYEAIPEGIRVELIDGVIYDIDAPSFAHQLILGQVFSAMHRYRNISGKKDCMPVMAPYDVQLDMDDRTMVQPDLLVVCKKKGREVRKRLHGAPEFVMEVLSDSTRKKDMEDKRAKYSAAGVREYWIVDPDEQAILVYDFEGLNFPKTYTFHDKVPVLISGGELVIDFNVVREELENFLG